MTAGSHIDFADGTRMGCDCRTCREIRLSDFLSLYPTDGPDAGTGPRSRAPCECGHEVWKHHHTLGACLFVIWPTYCPCLEYRQVQP